MRGSLIRTMGLTTLVTTTFLTTSGRADFLTPASRGAASTTYQEWDIFGSAGGPNNPDVADDNANGSANLYDHNPATGETDGVFVLGSGNLYSFSGTPHLHVDIPNFNLGAGYETTVVFQLRNLGTEVDLGTVTLTPLGGSAVGYDSYRELSRTSLGPQGFQVDSLFAWTVAGNAASYEISFTAQGSSMSVDRVAIDTSTRLQAVPEPSAMASMSAGMCVVAAWWSWRRRRRRPTVAAIV